MSIKKVQGITLYKISKQKGDAIFRLITPEGVFGIYAHQSKDDKKKLKIIKKIPSLVECEIIPAKGENKISLLEKITYISQIKVEGRWANIYLKKYLELVSQSNNSSPHFYSLILDINKILDSTIAYSGWIWLLAQFIKNEGYKFSTKSCVDCQKNENIYAFEIQSGGLKCKRHAFSSTKEQKIEDILQFIYLFEYDFQTYLKNVNEHKLMTIEKVLEQFINNHVGVYFRIN